MLNSAFVSMYTLHGLCSRFYPHLPVFLVLAAGESSTSIRPNGISCIRRSSGSGSGSCSVGGGGGGGAAAAAAGCCGCRRSQSSSSQE